KNLFYIFLIITVAACQRDIQVEGTLNEEVQIFPDYKEVTIPSNLAPLDFQTLNADDRPTCLIVQGDNTSFQVRGEEGAFDIPTDQWKDLLRQQTGKDITFTVCMENQGKWSAFPPFTVHVANEPVDRYLVYRLLAPGYGLWGKMGIYQRDLETFEQKPLYENKTTEMNCVNCHSFQMQNPKKMMMHFRAWHGGTVIFNEGHIEKLNTKTDEMISGFVYPYWHPTEDYIAFSNNIIGQSFFMYHANRVEAFDAASDVVVYNIKTHEVISSPLLKSEEAYESFPIFSPDGKSLYFTSAKALQMPDHYKEMHYNLCRIDFDSKTGTFGNQVDTVYCAEKDSMSISFPRISPDGKHMVMVRQPYGHLSIWHKDADLCILHLDTGEVELMDAANSNDAESYHSWSSNSRWMV
ncbi:MAG: PD40 domain-containing protein, partial [Bacteroidaceae bacterium]|nr:PD40 domain-containing protein [Bacteroidaceae bacterium]